MLNKIFRILVTCAVLLPAHHILYSEQKQFLVLNNPVDCGFGAVFSSVLSALDMYERDNYSGIHVDLNSGIYVDPQRGPNWWEYFFKPINIGDATAPERVLNQHDVAWMVNSGFTMPRERGYELIKRYVHLRPEIANEIENFVNKNFKGHFVIGVHHRGTDKILENTLVPYEKTLFHIDWWMQNVDKKDKPIVFVATDDQQFLDTVKKKYGKRVVYCNFVRSSNGQPLHYGAVYENNYQKGKEALLDCILLSKCNLLLFPCFSAFSMATLKFNPSMPAIPLAGD